jgi:hypothetical protein
MGRGLTAQMLPREDVPLADRLVLGREPEREAVAHQAKPSIERRRATPELSTNPKWLCTDSPRPEAAVFVGDVEGYGANEAESRIGRAPKGPTKKTRFRFAFGRWLAVAMFYIVWPMLALMAVAPFLIWLFG